jgi:branched-chain amino acid aminotransferase
LTLANDLAIPTSERPVDRSELLIADEVFLCGTAAKIAPVQQIENYRLPNERPITEKLKAELTAITNKQNLRYQDWIDTVILP